MLYLFITNYCWIYSNKLFLKTKQKTYWKNIFGELTEDLSIVSYSIYFSRPKTFYKFIVKVKAEKYFTLTFLIFIR